MDRRTDPSTDLVVLVAHRCPSCRGSGRALECARGHRVGTVVVSCACATCDGAGWVTDHDRPTTTAAVCPECRGAGDVADVSPDTGEFVAIACPRCAGWGAIDEPDHDGGAMPEAA